MQGDNEELLSMPRRALNLTFNDISYTIRSGAFKTERRQLLKNISGDFRVGELTAIMGPSGAGKSTLIDILAGFTNPTSGVITVDGNPRNRKEFRRISSYIMQDDVLEPLLTVQESLYIAANLKILSSTHNRKQRVDVIIAAMGLESCRHERTSQLSGGEKKRLAIALELISNPPVMFIDEPTSGLDYVASKQCINLLKTLARDGPRIIIISIHQPSATLFDMMDHLYVIVDGYCVYTGGTKPVVPYLAENQLYCPTYHNPADFLMEVCNGDYGDYQQKMVEKIDGGKCNDWREMSGAKIQWNFGCPLKSGFSLAYGHVEYSSNDNQADGRISTEYATSFPKQLCILFARNTIKLSRDKVLTFIRLSMHCIIAFIVGILYYGIGQDANYVIDNYKLLFFSVMFLMFSAFSATATTYPSMLPIIMREHFNRWYRLRSFYLANKLADLPIQMIAVLLYTVIFYFLSGQIMEFQRFFLLLMAYLVVSLVAQLIGLIIGAGMTIHASVIFGPLFIMPFVVFSGFFVLLKDSPYYLQWLFHASFLKYGFETVMSSMYGFGRKKMYCSAVYCHYAHPKLLLREMGMLHTDYWFSMIILLGLYIILDIIAFIILRLRLKKFI